MFNSTFKNQIKSNIEFQDDPVLTAIKVDYFSNLKNNPRKKEIEKHFDFNGFIGELLTIQSSQTEEENNNKLLMEFIVNWINKVADFQHDFQHDETCSDILIAITLAIKYFITCDNQSGNLLLPPDGTMIDCTHELIIGIKSENIMITADHYYDPDIALSCAIIRDLDLSYF